MSKPKNRLTKCKHCGGELQFVPMKGLRGGVYMHLIKIDQGACTQIREHIAKNVFKRLDGQDLSPIDNNLRHSGA